MKVEEVQAHLDSIYVDYFDGLYSDYQLKQMLKKLYLKTNISIDDWSEMILDAQWKHANDQDYENKIAQT